MSESVVRSKHVQDTPSNLEARLNAHPRLRVRVEALLEVVENTSQTVEKADDAEQRVLEELRHMGAAVLQAWAAHQERSTAKARQHSTPAVRNHKKKNSRGTPALGQ